MNHQRSVHALRTPPGTERARASWRSPAQWLREAYSRARRRALLRRELAWLDERAMHDMNADRIDLEIEAAKPFWRK